jgi:hypothetical protein
VLDILVGVVGMPERIYAGCLRRLPWKEEGKSKKVLVKKGSGTDIIQSLP